jgi:hypothetical protein
MKHLAMALEITNHLIGPVRPDLEQDRGPAPAAHRSRWKWSRKKH